MISFGSLTVQGIPENHVQDCVSEGRRLITLTAPADGGFCEVTVSAHFPYPSQAYRLDVWTAAHGFPANLSFACERRITFSDSCHGTVLPMLTLMDKQNKKGASIIVPPGSEPGGRFYFDLDDYFGSGVAVVFRNIGLAAGESVTIEILLKKHEACYRPALQWMTETYPEYFYPRCARVWEDQGPFVMTNPCSTERLLDDAQSRGAKWSEIHNHFPWYGNYAPQEEEWDSVISHDYPDLPPLKISVQKINEHIGNLHRHNIAGMLYIQCGGDAYVPWIESAYPEARAISPAGETLPTWMDCIIACDDGKSEYSSYVKEMIRRFLKNYPDIDGVFLDQFCYNTLDQAHSDGRCAVNGKPAAMTGSGYRHGIEELIAGLGPEKRIWANGCFNLSAARYADGIMAEGTGVIAAALKYLCLKKPMLNHAYSEQPELVEALMRNCLLTGSGWSLGGSSKVIDPGAYSPEVESVFARFLPLIAPLQETEIFLGPDPVSFPAGFAGEIFKHKKEEQLYFVTLTGHSLVGKLNVTLRGVDVKQVSFRSLEEKEWQPAEVKENVVTVPGGCSAYTLRIQG